MEYNLDTIFHLLLNLRNSTFYLSILVSELSESDIDTFQSPVRPINSQEQIHSFWKSRQSNLVCHLSWLNCPLGKNSSGTPTFTGLMKNLAALPDTLGRHLIAGVPTNYSYLIAIHWVLTMERLQHPSKDFWREGNCYPLSLLISISCKMQIFVFCLSIPCQAYRVIIHWCRVFNLQAKRVVL